MFSLRFWGVRGSIPCPGQSTLEFGGNTTCLEIRTDERLFIIDMGTGIKALGDSLVKTALKNSKLDINIFITHTHWDHIMGFPMFSPVFSPNAKIKIWGPVSYNGEPLSSIVSGQLSYKYWPVRLNELVAGMEFEELKETKVDLGGGLILTTKFLNHSITCLGYRFDYKGSSIVCAFDHEPYRNMFPSDPKDPAYNEAAAVSGEAAANEENEKIISFYKDADILVHDAQFLPKEFNKRLGWGHSSYDYAIEAALAANVKKLVFFHHEPNRTDSQLRKLEERYKMKLKGKKRLSVVMAKEGMKLKA